MQKTSSILKLRKMIKETIQKLNESDFDNLKLAKRALDPYRTVLSKFSPGKIQHAPGNTRDTYFIELKVRDQIEAPALMIEFETEEDENMFSSNLPFETVAINIWTKVDSEKYKQGILKLLQILSMKNPTMPVLWDEDNINGTVKKWADINQLNKML